MVQSQLVADDVGRGAQARLALLRAAVDVFGECGVEAATTRGIAQRSGQNIAAIAYYFGGKEGLYLAVAEHIVELLAARVGTRLDEIESFLRSDAPSPERCLDHIKSLLALGIATNQAMLPATGIIVREQIHPTRAFSILYDGCLGRLQRLGAELVHTYLGPQTGSDESIVRFHALLGQSLAFRFARETVLRRAGWKEIGPAEEAVIRDAVTEHAELALRGLRRKARRKGEP